MLWVFFFILSKAFFKLVTARFSILSWSVRRFIVSSISYSLNFYGEGDVLKLSIPGTGNYCGFTTDLLNLFPEPLEINVCFDAPDLVASEWIYELLYDYRFDLAALLTICDSWSSNFYIAYMFREILLFSCFDFSYSFANCYLACAGS